MSELLILFKSKATTDFKEYVRLENPSELELIHAYNNYILGLHRDLMYNKNQQSRIRSCTELNYLVKTFEYYIQASLIEMSEKQAIRDTSSVIA